MLDRQKVEAILGRRFSGATRVQIAAAANGIMGLPDEWEEALHDAHEGRYYFSNECGNVCYLTEDLAPGIEFRLFKRREG